jgi:outer membrane lipoprotein-sorting protein
MGEAYQRVIDYQTRVESTVQREDGSLQTKKVLYTFKKPHRIRLDFESPNRGMVLVYPDKNGKAVIRPSGWARIFTFRFAPDNFLLQASLGQRIDQTDLGLLIRNIAHSLTDGRRGEMDVKEGEEHIRITVTADDHFREGVVTRYGFTIDTKLWLPIEVGESLPDGNLERKVFFRNLRVNIGVPDSFFEPDGG